MAGDLLAGSGRDAPVAKHLVVSEVAGGQAGVGETRLHVVEVAQLGLGPVAPVHAGLADGGDEVLREGIEVAAVVPHRDDTEPQVPQRPVLAASLLPQLGTEALHPLRLGVAHHDRDLGPAAPARTIASIVERPSGGIDTVRLRQSPCSTTKPNSSSSGQLA